MSASYRLLPPPDRQKNWKKWPEEKICMRSMNLAYPKVVHGFTVAFPASGSIGAKGVDYL